MKYIIKKNGVEFIGSRILMLGILISAYKQGFFNKIKIINSETGEIFSIVKIKKKLPASKHAGGNEE